MHISYLNTDLDLVALFDITPLAQALDASGVFALDIREEEDGWHGTFETSGQYGTPEPNIIKFLNVIEGFDATIRALWSDCTMRQFDIGYDCGDEPNRRLVDLSNRTLTRIAEAGASLRFSLYALRPLTEANEYQLTDTRVITVDETGEEDAHCG